MIRIALAVLVALTATGAASPRTPALRLPAPTGPYAVGVHNDRVTDIPVRVWYPAVRPSRTPAQCALTAQRAFLAGMFRG